MGNQLIATKRKNKHRTTLQCNDFDNLMFSPQSDSESDSYLPSNKPHFLHDQRRLVFVSLIGLFRSWKSVSLPSMCSALLLMPLHRQCIYEPYKYRGDFNRFLSSDTVEMQSFIDFLKFKDSQGLAVWMLDRCTPMCDDMDPLIDPFWYSLNQILTALVDPATGTRYSPLHLETKWWKHKCKSIDVRFSEILTELYLLSMKYRTMQEIIHQSNPNTLHPVVTYDESETHSCNKMRWTKTTSSGIRSMYRTNDSNVNDTDDNDNDTWWISEEYDPYS
eukprot:524778_1